MSGKRSIQVSSSEGERDAGHRTSRAGEPAMGHEGSYGGEESTMAVPVYIPDASFELEGEATPRAYRIPRHRPVRIYCDGVYDLFHYGHARQLQQAKHLFPSVYLIAGVHGDEDTLRYKGVAVMSAKERCESVRHCRHVDEVVENAPWLITDDFVRSRRIDYVAHDEDPYSCSQAGESDIYGWLKAENRFVPTRRTVNISTSCLITRIIRNRGIFIDRQVSRGVSREDLNDERYEG